MRPPAEEAARGLVAERYPDAVQAWLAGSTTTGRATETSDLDITVLLDPSSPDVEVHRESLVHAGWPVELFVHTAASVDFFVAKDLQRRHPTMARLVATGVPLLGDGGADVRARCAEVLERGPEPLAADELDLMRYGLTDLLDDLADVAPGAEASAVVVAVWRATAELALGSAGAWNGTGKWLVRELQALDERRGTRLTEALDLGLRRALAGERESLTTVADQVLAGGGGRRWAGLHLTADVPEAPGNPERRSHGERERRS
jgi:predicted nucleotidyltransferase